MADRTDLPKIHPQGEPSILNEKAADWGTNAALISMLVAKFSGLGKKLGEGKTALAVYGAGAAAALWGGVQGKADQEKEKIEGRTVKDPGYWNKGILTGVMIGGIPAQILELQGKKSYTRLSIIGMAAGAIVGSILRNNSLKTDFDQALAQRDSDYQELERLRLEKQLRAELAQLEATAPAPAPHAPAPHAPSPVVHHAQLDGAQHTHAHASHAHAPHGSHQAAIAEQRTADASVAMAH